MLKALFELNFDLPKKSTHFHNTACFVEMNM